MNRNEKFQPLLSKSTLFLFVQLLSLLLDHLNVVGTGFEFFVRRRFRGAGLEVRFFEQLEAFGVQLFVVALKPLV